jgi:serine/threonine-protein kinase RsbW/stage II sporulation protein AB (anti-sigma F factor)
MHRVGRPTNVPTGYQSRLKECLPARAENIALLRRAVVAYAGSNGASERQREDIALAVSEALSNAVLHAYVGRDSPGDVGVDAWIDERALEVVVCDDGVGMLPRADSPGLGLGLSLIARMTEHLEVESPDATRGMRLRMTFAIG